MTDHVTLPERWPCETARLRGFYFFGRHLYVAIRGDHKMHCGRLVGYDEKRNTDWGRMCILDIGGDFYPHYIDVYHADLRPGNMWSACRNHFGEYWLPSATCGADTSHLECTLADYGYDDDGNPITVQTKKRIQDIVDQENTSITGR